MGVTAFSYKPGFSLLHRCPAWIKILLIPVISIAVFELPPAFALTLALLQILVSFLLHFSVHEQLADLRAVLYYAVILIFAKLAGALLSLNLQNFIISFIKSEKETWILLLKLFCVMQATSLLFKTSTSLQIRTGLETIELKIRHFLHLKSKTPLAEAIALFICFIPQVSRNWEQTKKAWFARGGKKSLKMLIILLPVLFSVSMKQAYNTALALSIRK